MIYSKALRETKCRENKLYKLEQTGYLQERVGDWSELESKIIKSCYSTM